MKFVYLICFIFFIILGIVGLIFPIIPQVPFFLAAFYFLTKMSTRLANFIEKTFLFRLLTTTNNKVKEQKLWLRILIYIGYVAYVIIFGYVVYYFFIKDNLANTQ